jgi:hypothetical protein
MPLAAPITPRTAALISTDSFIAINFRSAIVATPTLGARADALT